MVTFATCGMGRAPAFQWCAVPAPCVAPLWITRQTRRQDEPLGLSCWADRPNISTGKGEGKLIGHSINKELKDVNTTNARQPGVFCPCQENLISSFEEVQSLLDKGNVFVRHLTFCMAFG